MKILDIDETKLTNPNHPKIKDLIDNEEPYIAELKTMHDKVLARKLENVRIQKGWAIEQEKWVELDVLRIFEDMIIAARIFKMEENPDSKEYDEPITKPKKKKIKTPSQKVKHSDKDLKFEESGNENDIDKFEEKKPEQLSLFDSLSED